MGRTNEEGKAMTVVFAEHDLFDACRVLFGTELEVNRAFLEYLQRPGIKSAYRQKALTTHPDVLACQGDAAQQQGARLFRVVQQAYEHLTTYLDARDNGFRFPPLRPARPAAPAKAKPQASPRPEPWVWPRADSAKSQGRPRPSRPFTQAGGRPASAWQTAGPWRATSIPSRPLLFGHFLLYAGVTNWQTIIKALVWQRTGRPRLGEIGRRFGWLSEKDILHILKHRKLSQPFGASAIRLGFLTERQLGLMIFQQHRMQKKFGEYFIDQQLLSPSQVNELARQFVRHNTSFAPRRPTAARM